MMDKRKTKAFLRLENTLSRDRLSVGDEFFELLLKDAGKFLSEYAELVGCPEINVEKKSGKFEITITASATRLKNAYSGEKTL